MAFIERRRAVHVIRGCVTQIWDLVIRLALDPGMVHSERSGKETRIQLMQSRQTPRRILGPNLAAERSGTAEFFAFNVVRTSQ